MSERVGAKVISSGMWSGVVVVLRRKQWHGAIAVMAVCRSRPAVCDSARRMFVTTAQRRSSSPPCTAAAYAATPSAVDVHSDTRIPRPFNPSAHSTTARWCRPRRAPDCTTAKALSTQTTLIKFFVFFVSLKGCGENAQHLNLFG